MNCIKLLFLFILISLSCSVKSEKNIKVDKFNKRALYQNYNLQIKKEMIYGGNSIKEENYLVGRVADFTIDKHGNIYICDDINIGVKKFSKDGKYVCSFGSGEGKGPGEFLEPRRIQIDENDNLFVLDYKLRRITIFNAGRDIIKIIPIKTNSPGNFLISNGKAYVVGFGLYNTPPIQIINLKNGDLIDSFGKRTVDSLIVSKTGNSGTLCFNEHGDIYYSGYYPYKISLFSKEGKEIRTFSRKATFLRPPARIRSRNTGRFYICSQGGVRDIDHSPNGILLVLVDKWPQINKKDEMIVQYLDLFDASGNWLLSISIAEIFKNMWTRTIKIDYCDFIYFSSDNPFPHVEKYSIVLKDEKDNLIFYSRSR